ncbi:MAG: thioredoxin [Chloroflexi bacterium]|nr:thioredoxin [Chloroflexota bacterium]
MADLIHFSDNTFESEVLQASGPVLVDFTATWCGPCHMLAPIVEQLAQEWAGKVKVGKLDIDENVGTTMQYQVMGVPTLILFVDGQARERLVGYMPKDRIVSRLRPHLL